LTAIRVALDATDEVGIRTGRILLAERDLEWLGLVGRTPRSEDPRMRRADELSAYDLIVSDDTADPEVAVRTALHAGIGCVLFSDGEGLEERYHEAFVAVGRTLLLGANLAAGIAPSLAAHETARGGEIMEVTIGWTEPGAPLRRGEPLPFPDPVGARWARSRPTEPGYQAFVAPVPGNWAGAVARVTSVTSAGVVTRVVGVADLAAHLEAIALAAGVMSLDVFAPGAHRPAFAAEVYLAAALQAGLDVATYSLPG
jgi:hypothetical protein